MKKAPASIRANGRVPCTAGGHGREWATARCTGRPAASGRGVGCIFTKKRLLREWGRERCVDSRPAVRPEWRTGGGTFRTGETRGAVSRRKRRGVAAGRPIKRAAARPASRTTAAENSSASAALRLTSSKPAAESGSMAKPPAMKT